MNTFKREIGLWWAPTKAFRGCSFTQKLEMHKQVACFHGSPASSATEGRYVVPESDFMDSSNDGNGRRSFQHCSSDVRARNDHKSLVIEAEQTRMTREGCCEGCQNT
ncbi:hypothetical protein MRX96_046795 [Rhipicephalus microplus]